MCLAQNDAADLRAAIRTSSSDDDLATAIGDAIRREPKGHDFAIDHSIRNQLWHAT